MKRVCILLVALMSYLFSIPLFADVVCGLDLDTSNNRIHVNNDEDLSLTYFDEELQKEVVLEWNPSNIASSTVRQSAGGFPDVVGTQSIIGTDERERVMNTTSKPFYGIVYIHASFSNNTYTPSTGFMISENCILTGAHCVYSNGELCTKVTVYPGRNGDTYTLKTTSTKVYLSSAYKTDPKAENDYAIIKLDEPLGLTTGWFGINVATDSELLNKPIMTAGYPDEKANGDYRELWRASGIVNSVSTSKFYHTADTTSGQSGSPVYFYNTAAGEYQAIGIHTNGTTNSNVFTNSCRRITAAFYDMLLNHGFIHE